jgi:hypothetical protein
MPTIVMCVSTLAPMTDVNNFAGALFAEMRPDCLRRLQISRT